MQLIIYIFSGTAVIKYQYQLGPDMVSIADSEIQKLRPDFRPIKISTWVFLSDVIREIQAEREKRQARR